MCRTNILVSAAALRTSGARTIYLQFIEHLKSRVDGNYYYIMVDKDMEMPEIKGVSYWVIDVSNKLKRFKFELYGFKRLLKNKMVDIDAIISLQNLGIHSFRCLPQIIYYHQSLPFFDYKWNPFRKEELGMILYKYFYPYLVKYSIGKRTEMVVQLPSIKRKVINRYGLSLEHVYVLFPDLENLNVEEIPPFIYYGDSINFIFPATNAPYKGHSFLLDVMQHIWKRNEQIAQSIRIHVTLNKIDERTLMKNVIDNRVKNNFVFHGVVPHQQLLSMYKSSDGLLFPSVIETLGLPLIEAARIGKPIIACDLEYAHEVLNDYDGATFVSPRSGKDWAEAILNVVKEHNSYGSMQQPQRSSWEDFFDIVRKTTNNCKK